MTKIRNIMAGERTYLRQLQQADLHELQVRYRASRAHFRGRANSEFTDEVFARLLAEVQLETNEYFLICFSEDDSIIGTIGLSQIFRKSFQNAYLGYQLFAGFTGRGYMTEAVRAVIRFAFQELKLHRIEANVQPSNTPSIRVLERAGFSKEGFSRSYLKIGGRWRDHERWAIIREDWRPR